MDLTRIDLNLLLAFEALTQTGSVSQAATRLGLRQPAMSAALARLRHLFGDPLFQRAAGAMQPTPRARALTPGILAALAQLRETLGAALPFVPGQTRQSFTLASTDYTSLVLVEPLLAAMGLAAASVDLHLIGYDKDDVGALIDQGAIDLALGVFPVPPERAVCQGLLTEHFVGVARADHPALAGLTPQAYAKLPHALVTQRRDRVGAIDQALAAQGLHRRVAFSCPHFLVLPGILAQSDLVAALPARLARRLAAPGLATFALPIPVPPWQVAMLWNPAARTDQGNAWLRGLILQVAAVA